MRRQKPLCTIEGCNRPNNAKGMCSAHYMRHKAGKEMTLGHKTPVRDYMEEWLKEDTDECFPWPHFTTTDGYPIIRLNGENVRVHTIACELQNGPKPFEAAVVRHLCGNGMNGCFNPKHVVWGTIAENNRDRVIHETIPRGEDCHFSKLSEKQVLDIYNSKISAPKEATKYGINKTAVYRIRSGKSWSWLTGHKKRAA